MNATCIGQRMERVREDAIGSPATTPDYPTSHRSHRSARPPHICSDHAEASNLKYLTSALGHGRRIYGSFEGLGVDSAAA
jgi:hypothetical protein